MSTSIWCPRCGTCCQLNNEGQCSGAYEGVCHIDNPDPEDPISLQEQLDTAQDQLAAANARAELVEQRVAALEAALEFYDDERIYECTPWGEGFDGMPRIDSDHGARARDALATRQDAAGAVADDA